MVVSNNFFGTAFFCFHGCQDMGIDIEQGGLFAGHQIVQC